MGTEASYSCRCRCRIKASNVGPTIGCQQEAENHAWTVFRSRRSHSEASDSDCEASSSYCEASARHLEASYRDRKASSGHGPACHCCGRKASSSSSWTEMVANEAGCMVL